MLCYCRSVLQLLPVLEKLNTCLKVISAFLIFKNTFPKLIPTSKISSHTKMLQSCICLSCQWMSDSIYYFLKTMFALISLFVQEDLCTLDSRVLALSPESHFLGKMPVLRVLNLVFSKGKFSSNSINLLTLLCSRMTAVCLSGDSTSH